MKSVARLAETPTKSTTPRKETLALPTPVLHSVGDSSTSYTKMSVMIQSMVRALHKQCAPYATTSPALSSGQPSPKRQRIQHSPSQSQCTTLPTPHSPAQPHPRHHTTAEQASSERKTLEGFLEDVRTQFEAPLGRDRLLSFSQQIQSECRDRLAESDISMLPSYQHTLPTGDERGDFLALDVGGSTLRVALIRLDGKGRDGDDSNSDDGMEIRRTRKFDITEKIRKLEGEAFFDWMAARIEEMLLEHKHLPVDSTDSTQPLPMGLAWSFPVEQTSPRSGKLLAMGKGFCATHGVEGQDLSELIMRACTRRGLPVEMRAIVNDGAATLLAQTYRDPTTRMSLILGTGTNACVYLPVRALGVEKFGARPKSWFAAATHVLVNTELSMLGREALPTTSWDDDLNAQHRLPDFQPLEYLTTGRYLGEIVRLILLDAIAQAGLFAGRIPSGLDEPYTLDTRILAAFEADSSAAGLNNAAAAFLEVHPIASPSSDVSSSEPPSTADWSFVRSITRLVTHRAAAYLATALHALWRIRTQSEDVFLQSTESQAGSSASNASATSLASSADQHISVACHGTIAEQYPGYRDRCQKYLDDLCGAAPGTVTLAVAPESSIFGAAVAVGCMEGREG